MGVGFPVGTGFDGWCLQMLGGEAKSKSSFSLFTLSLQIGSTPHPCVHVSTVSSSFLGPFAWCPSNNLKLYLKTWRGTTTKTLFFSFFGCQIALFILLSFPLISSRCPAFHSQRTEFLGLLSNTLMVLSENVQIMATEVQQRENMFFKFLAFSINANPWWHVSLAS